MIEGLRLLLHSMDKPCTRRWDVFAWHRKNSQAKSCFLQEEG